MTFPKMNEYEKAIIARGDDLRERMQRAEGFVGRFSAESQRAADRQKVVAFYKDLLAVVEAHELQLQLAKAMEPV